MGSDGSVTSNGMLRPAMATSSRGAHRTETVLNAFAVARSNLPSRLKSARSVAIDDVGSEPEPGGLADGAVNPAAGLAEDEAAVRRRAQARVVEGHLPLRLDAGIRAAAGGAVQLVDIRAVFIERDAASHPGAVGKNQDVLAHAKPFK